VAQVLQVILDALPTLMLGAVVTLQLTIITTILGMILGSLIGILRLSNSRIIRTLTIAYIDFFRGSPLLVQIFMIYFGLPALARGLGLGLNLNQWTAAVAALTLNVAAYIAEIVRGAIQSIELGQREASESLGLGPVETMRYIIFPQAFRRMIPPLGNLFISQLKDTSLVAVIGFEELFRRGQLIVAQNYRAFEIYFAVALVYLVLNLLSARAFDWLERAMNPLERAKRRAVVQPAGVLLDPGDR
jgi:arginine/lysine/histidine/glutamine transport system substrate-binding/permease protein